MIYLKFWKQKKLNNLIIGSSETTREAPFSIKNLSNILNLNFKKQSLLICYSTNINIKKMLNLEEKNKHNFISSSFDFEDYKQNHSPSHVKTVCEFFLQWFIGFTEGDGCFYIKQNTPNYFTLIFELSQKDPKVLYRIRKTLGFGRVVQKNMIQKTTGEKYFYWVYTVSDKRGIQRLLAMLNGNLILPKRRYQLNKWIEMAKIRGMLPVDFINKQLDIYKGPKISLDTGWVSGFIDSEGCFYAGIKMPRSKLGYSIKQKIHLTQKSIHGEEKVLEDIGTLFKTKSKVKRCFSKGGLKPLLANKENKNNKNESFYYRIEMSSLETHKEIVKYLKKFKLKTNKSIAFHRWARVVQARDLGQHLNPTRLPKLETLCKSINRATKIFIQENRNLKELSLYEDLELTDLAYDEEINT